MIVRAIPTAIVTPESIGLFELLDEYVTEMEERSVLAITSKVVSLCEGAVVPVGSIDKAELIKREADRYVEMPLNEYGIIFTVVGNTLMPNAGIDESNAGDVYVLWPRDPQATANEVRAYLAKRFGLEQVGVVITDSTTRPLRWGVGGVAIAHSGFKEINDYRGKDDLFGRELKVSTAAVAEGLASAATLVMGEGAECTPLAMLSELPFVEFQPRDPSQRELEALKISVENDVYGPLLSAVDWRSKRP